MADDRQLLTDIRLALRQHDLRPVYAVAEVRQRVTTKGGPRLVPDLGVVAGGENLGQAIVLRLLTPRGELAALGHPEYGSRLHELVGRENTENVRNLARLYILESLQAEPRVAKVLRIAVEPVAGRRDRFDVTAEVRPVGAASTVTIGPFTLALEP